MDKQNKFFNFFFFATLETVHPWQSGRLHRTHNAAPKGHRWFKSNRMQFIFSQILFFVPKNEVFWKGMTILYKIS